MANFEAKEIDVSSIHGGQRYQNGDLVDPEAINSPIEASFYAQEIAKSAATMSQAALERVQGALGATSAFSLLDAYPVGSIYISVSSASPAYLFGGTWSRIQDRFLLACGSTYSAGSTGGSADAVLVSHNHSWLMQRTSSGSSLDGYIMGGGYTLDIEYNIPTSTVGEDGTGKNMPPYLSVYMWQRIG